MTLPTDDSAHAVVLIAEDDHFIQKMYKHNFEQAGIAFVMAKNGEEAIAAMDTQQPALLLLDLLMPKVDGFRVLEYIEEKGYTFPVIVTSNLSEEVDREKCSRFDIKGYFVKSDMDISELVEMVQKYLP